MVTFSRSSRAAADPKGIGLLPADIGEGFASELAGSTTNEHKQKPNIHPALLKQSAIVRLIHQDYINEEQSPKNRVEFNITLEEEVLGDWC